jgi:hypothetical protein
LRKNREKKIKKRWEEKAELLYTTPIY